MRALLGFTGLSILCGAAVHLVAELASLGASADGELIFSARHVPLALLSLGACAALGLAALPGRWGGRGAAAAIVRCLPGGGTGVRFFFLALAAQAVVFGVTQAGEGMPIRSGDLGPALAAALIACALGALFVARCKACVIEAVIDLFSVVAGAATTALAQSWKRIDAHVRVWRRRSVVFAASRRPPPPALLTNPHLALGLGELHGVQTFSALTRSGPAVERWASGGISAKG